jgi:PAS domain S-box-containing protein
MGQPQYKILALFILYSLCFPARSFCSTEQKKPVPGNHSLRHEWRVVDSLNSIACKVKDSNIRLSQVYAMKAMILSKSFHYLKGEGEALLLLGQYYLYTNNFPKSIEVYYSALDIAKQSNDIKLKTTALRKICAIFIMLKRSDKAKSYFEKSFSLAMTNKDTSNIIELLFHLSEINVLENKPEKAIWALYRASWFCNKKEDRLKIAWIHKHIGNYFLSKMDLNTAEYYYKKAIFLNQKENFIYEIGTLYTLMGHISFLENKLTESLNYNKMALNFRQKSNQQDQIASSFLNIGRSYILLNKPDSALIYFRKGLDLSNKLNIDYFQVRGNKFFYELYLQKREWKTALNFYRAYTEAKDSLTFTQKREETAIFEANQFISENEKKSDQLETENRLQKTTINYNHIQIVFLVILVLIILGVLYYTYRQFVRNKKSKIALQQLNDKLDIEIDERKQVEVQLRKSEILHHFLTDNSLDVISRIDKHYKYVYISPSCINIYGYNQQEMMEMNNVYALVDPDVLETLYIGFKEMLRSKEPSKFTYRSRRKDGSSFWAESHINPIFDKESGELTDMITVMRDISARIAQEEALIESSRQKELLMREIHHRAKNNFVILISLLNFQKFQTQNHALTHILSDLEARIRTMVLIHEQLYRSKSVDIVSFGQYIITLAKSISSAFKKEGITMHSEISECLLNIETALPLGLIVNELLTNSYKYAFNETGRGNIHIMLNPVINDPEDETQKWEMIIEDDGVGLPESFRLDTGSTTGSKIIQTLADQIAASIHFSGDEGASFRIIFSGPEHV